MKGIVDIDTSAIQEWQGSSDAQASPYTVLYPSKPAAQTLGANPSKGDGLFDRPPSYTYTDAGAETVSSR